MKATVSQVRRMYADAYSKPRKPWAGWAGFKHKLVDADIIKNVDCDVPQEWQEAFKKACNR